MLKGICSEAKELGLDWERSEDGSVKLGKHQGCKLEHARSKRAPQKGLMRQALAQERQGTLRLGKRRCAGKERSVKTSEKWS